MNDQTAFPLCWPEGWARTLSQRRRPSIFTRPIRFAARFHSMSEARDFLAAELRRLGALKQVLSTNVQLRLAGALQEHVSVTLNLRAICEAGWDPGQDVPAERRIITP